LDPNSLASIVVILTANGERRESHVVLDKELATRSQDVTNLTNADQASPREPLLVAPSREPRPKDTVTLESVCPSETGVKKLTLNLHLHLPNIRVHRIS